MNDRSDRGFQSPNPRVHGGLFHRVAITLAALTAFVLAEHGRVPGVAFEHGPRPHGLELHSSVADRLLIDHSLGAMCFGFLVAGLASRLLSRAWRRDIDLERAAWWIACALTLATGRWRGATHLDCQHIAGLFALFGLSRVISNQGLVHGFAALLGAYSLDELYAVFLRAWQGTVSASLDPASALVWTLALGATVAITALTLCSTEGMRARLVTSETSYDTAYRVSHSSALEVLPALRTPSSAGDAMMVFPFLTLGAILFCEVFGFELPAWLHGDPRHLGYCGVYLAVTLGCVAWFIHTLNPAAEVAAGIAQATGLSPSHAPIESARAAVRAGVARATLFIVAITALGWLQELATFGALGDYARIAMILTAVVLDAVAAMRAQKTLGTLTSVRTETRVWAADLVSSLLAAYDIPAMVSSRSYRTLQPFLGNLATIHVAVASSRSEEALDALAAAGAPLRRGPNADLN